MAAPLHGDDDEILKDDYYSLLNVSRQATRNEINQAYKQLSKIYHPDKHQDPTKKKNAELLFSKLKRAHEVLVDEHKRVIYDLYGEKGLETYGMEVVSRTKTPAEIIAEYERFQQEQEERRLQQCTNPKTSAVIAVNATDLFESYSYDDFDDEDDDEGPTDVVSRIPSIEISAMNVSQSVECPLTSQNTGVLAWSLSTENGNGSGVFTTTWKRLLSSRGSIEVASTFGSRSGLTFKFSRYFFKSLVFNFNTKLMLTERGIAPGLSTGLSYTFDKHWQGRIRWNILAPSNLNTLLVYHSETQQILFQITLSIRNSYIFTSYTRKFKEHDVSTTVSLKAGTFGAVLEYGIEKKITSFSNLGASMSIGYPTGVALRIKLDRGSHTILMPIRLSEDIIPSSVVYGTIIPVVTYFAVKKLIVDPFLSGQREKELEKKKQEQKEKILQRKREAQALIELMKETVERNLEAEEKKNGLIIITAVYGKLSSGHLEDLQTEDCIDVTIPLQALVKDSSLITPDKTTKSDLPGFYDPCIGEEKKLYIKYKFRKKIHHTTVEDMKNIRIPQQRHLMREDDLPPFINDPDET
ncbi:dnaJ homolog subfamily C member 11-like [Mercenaria mercenaria]|uniref:dnaJ homolog subfamily C member 11-like n=1 Tax=Mercenaria mercenaria TaxID=6596 RepID=UPI00234E96EE|nr:dnaJ homolog subfamily C member 11-like [Mercenaria mercenaria]